MLSPGQFWKLVPTDIVENLRFRKSLLAECMRSARTRELVWYACSQDIIFWINVFGWQTNPNMLDEEDGPFICHDFQREALLDTIRWNIEERQLVVWEKSRMQGGTYMLLFKDTWLTTFKKRKRSLVMSHSEKAVELADDEDTLFGKIDFIISHLPSWMQDGLPRKKGVYRMSHTRSQIVGTTTTSRTGIGNRAHTVSGDEVSKWQDAEKTLSGLRDTGPVVAVGTHYGVGGKFYELCNDPMVRKIVLHWSKNPMYNRGLYRSAPHLKPHERVVDPKSNPLPPDYPMVTDGSPHGGFAPGLRSIYYDKLCRERSARDMAMHWDIDPAGASRQVFSPHLIRDLVAKYSKDPVWEGDIVCDPVGRFQGLREVRGGPLKLWIPFLPHHVHTGKWVQPSLYKVGGDIGAGSGATPSCLSGGDSMTGKKVLEYQFAHPPQARPANFARIASAICWLLSDVEGNPAQLVWDRTGPTGDTFGKALQEIGFRQFWYWRDEFVLNPKISDTPGWFASNESKKLLFEEYEEALREGKLTNPSGSSLKETMKFEYTKTGTIEHGEAVRSDDPTAGRMNHSDVVYADALMWKLMKVVSNELEEEDKITEEDQALMASGGLSFGWIEEMAGGGVTSDPFRR